jgi:Ca2+-binding EF-hand superfamily protein
MSKMVMIFLANKLNEDQIKKLRASFIEIDVNKNGYICVKELNVFFGG